MLRRLRSPRLARLLLLFRVGGGVLAAGSAGGAGAQALPDAGDRLPLGDLLEIVVLEDERELLAVDAEGGGSSTLRLRLDERVLWRDTRGLLGVVLTDERILAVATRSASWQEEDFSQGEDAGSVSVGLGDRVALFWTPRRVLGFVGTTSRFSEVRLGPREEIVRTATGANVAVAVTDRRSLGLSPRAGGFFPIRMQLRERLASVDAGSNLVTIRTDARILVFRGPTGTWEERRP